MGEGAATMNPWSDERLTSLADAARTLTASLDQTDVKAWATWKKTLNGLRQAYADGNQVDPRLRELLEPAEIGQLDESWRTFGIHAIDPRVVPGSDDALRSALADVERVFTDAARRPKGRNDSPKASARPIGREIVPKLKAIYARYVKKMTTTNSSGKILDNIWFDPAEVQELTGRWNPIRDELRATSTFDDLALRTLSVTAGTDFDGRGLVSARDVGVLLEDIKYTLDVLADLAADAYPVTVDREGVFLAGQPFDAMRAISKIVQTATKSILIVDGYVGETTLDVCSAKSKGVILSVLTGSKSTTASMKAHAQAFIKQHGELEIRSSSKFHDRFIVVDDVDLYHLGASIKDAGGRGCMFSRIEEPIAITTLLAAFHAEWIAAPAFI